MTVKELSKYTLANIMTVQQLAAMLGVTETNVRNNHVTPKVESRKKLTVIYPFPYSIDDPTTSRPYIVCDKRLLEFIDKRTDGNSEIISRAKKNFQFI